MRHLCIAALLLLATLENALGGDKDFSGAWVAWLCPNGVSRESGNCSNFVVELHQKDGRLCGAHFFSTAGAARIDEGAAPSITGNITDGTATVVAVSSRAAPPVRVKVEMKMSNGMLHWQRLENPTGDYLLPMQTRMTRSRSRTLFAPLFEQELRAVCLSAFTMAAENAARAQAEKPAASGSNP